MFLLSVRLSAGTDVSMTHSKIAEDAPHGEFLLYRHKLDPRRALSLLSSTASISDFIPNKVVGYRGMRDSIELCVRRLNPSSINNGFSMVFSKRDPFA
jgi:hypothetical protein